MPVGFISFDIDPDTIAKGDSTVQISFSGSVNTASENPVRFTLTLVTADPIYPNGSATQVAKWDDTLSVGIDKPYTKTISFSNQSGDGSCRVKLNGTDARKGQCEDNTDIDY